MKSKQVSKKTQKGKEKWHCTISSVDLAYSVDGSICCFYFMVAVILIILNVNSSVYECACVCMGSVFFGDGWMGNPSGCGGTLSLLDSELSRFSDGALDFQSMLPTFHRWNCDHVRCNEYPPSLTYSYWGISFEFLYVSLLCILCLLLCILADAIFGTHFQLLHTIIGLYKSWRVQGVITSEFRMVLPFQVLGHSCVLKKLQVRLSHCQHHELYACFSIWFGVLTGLQSAVQSVGIL